MNREFRFYQEHPSGRWYVDLPEWEGDKADLEMVMGADSFLTIMSEGNDEVRLILSDEKIEGADFLVLRGMGLFEEIEVGSGAWYILPKYMGIDYDHSSEEYWSMGASLNQRRRVGDEGALPRKPLSDGTKGGFEPLGRYHQRKDRLTTCQQPR